MDIAFGERHSAHGVGHERVGRQLHESGENGSQSATRINDKTSVKRKRSGVAWVDSQARAEVQGRGWAHEPMGYARLAACFFARRAFCAAA